MFLHDSTIIVTSNISILGTLRIVLLNSKYLQFSLAKFFCDLNYVNLFRSYTESIYCEKGHGDNEEEEEVI